jgi:hypothetical protein
MKLSTEIIQQLARLGGVALGGDLASIQWPSGTFSWSLERIRSQFPYLAGIDEYEIEDHIHPVRDLTFVSSDAGFWPGWIDDFQGTDPARFHPFSSDEAYFYFIGVSCPSANPDVYYVDHETTDEEPYHPQSYNLDTFLRVLK